MTTLIVYPAANSLVGSVPVPSDKSIGHRALLFGALCEGDTHISGFSHGEDNVSTASCLRAMGVVIDEPSPTELVVHGVGLDGLRAPERDLDCGNSGTTMRLLCGVLSATHFKATLTGDETFSRRPMMRVVGALQSRGAVIEGVHIPRVAGEVIAPLSVGPLHQAARLGPLEFESKISERSGQERDTPFPGLSASDPTDSREPTVSRDHTERMLERWAFRCEPWGRLSNWTRRDGTGGCRVHDRHSRRRLRAAFLLVALQIVPASRGHDSRRRDEPTRTGLLEIARDMGAGLAIEPQGERSGEPVAELHGWAAPLYAI